MKSAFLSGSVAASLAVVGLALGVMVACSDDSSDTSSAPSRGGDDGATAGGGPQRGGGSEQPSSDAGSGNEPYDPYDPGPSTSSGGAPGDGGYLPDDAAGGAKSDVGSAGAGGEAACVPAPPTLPVNVPATVAAPVTATLLRHFHAVGTQNYRCTMTPGQQGADPTYAWTFIGPVANMLNSCGTQVGTHFAAPNSAPPAPEWRYDVDGSSVVGTKVDGSPVPNAIPELLLKSADHGGAGVFTNVTFVQRLKTVGGAAPDAASCNVDQVDEESDVPYTAEYYFYSGGT